MSAWFEDHVQKLIRHVARVISNVTDAAAMIEAECTMYFNNIRVLSTSDGQTTVTYLADEDDVSAELQMIQALARSISAMVAAKFGNGKEFAVNPLDDAMAIVQRYFAA